LCRENLKEGLNVKTALSKLDFHTGISGPPYANDAGARTMRQHRVSDLLYDAGNEMGTMRNSCSHWWDVSKFKRQRALMTWLAQAKRPRVMTRGRRGRSRTSMERGVTGHVRPPCARCWRAGQVGHGASPRDLARGGARGPSAQVSDCHSVCGAGGPASIGQQNLRRRAVVSRDPASPRSIGSGHATSVMAPFHECDTRSGPQFPNLTR